MRKTITFYILNHAGSPIRQFTFSRLFIRFLCVFCIAALVSLGLGVREYLQLKKTVSNTVMMQQTIALQKGEIVSQRKQINIFAQQINALKNEIMALADFEKKIRIIANIEQSSTRDGVFGIGGPIPKDLDTKIPLQEKHNSLLREMHTQTHQLAAAAAHQGQRFGSLIEYLEKQVSMLAATPAIRPTKGWVTGRFGYRKSPFTGLREFHKGLDIANRKGSPIIATADGTVTFAGKKGFYGNLIVIDHGHGMVTRYAHAHKLLKKRGNKVKRGETIATVGTTGRTTGSHVHYEVMMNGVPVNPKKYILN